MAHGSEHHSHIEAVGGSDDVGIAQRAARLNDGSGPGSTRFFEAVGKREKRVRSHDGSLQ
jgi:hypothetical protein